MSEENVEGKMRDRIRRAWDGVNRKDYDAAIDAMEPIDNEAAWVPPPEMPEQVSIEAVMQ